MEALRSPRGDRGRAHRGAARIWLAAAVAAAAAARAQEEPAAPDAASPAGVAESGPDLNLRWRLEDFDVRLGPEDGLLATGPGGDPRFHLGGVFTVDTYAYDDRNVRHSGPFIDRATVRLEASWGPFGLRVAPDLRGIDTHGGFEEAWLSFSEARWLRVTAGLQSLPIGIESSIPEEDLPAFGYSFPAYLTTRSDFALRVEGEIRDGLFSYDLAASAGEGFSLQGDRQSGERLSARGMIYPLRPVDWSVTIPGAGYEIPILSGLFFSAGYAHTFDFEGTFEVDNPFRNTLFDAGRIEASDAEFLHLGYGADLGPFLLVHEFVSGTYRNLEVPGGGEETLADQVTAWAALFAWRITGEPYDSRPARRGERGGAPFPARPLWGGDPAQRGPGAIEAVVRYSNGDIDREFFDLGFTDYVHSSQEFRAFTAALNWYPARNLKAGVAVTRTIADQRPRAFDSHGRDTSVVVRVQYAF